MKVNFTKSQCIEFLKDKTLSSAEKELFDISMRLFKSRLRIVKDLALDNIQALVRMQYERNFAKSLFT